MALPPGSLLIAHRVLSQPHFARATNEDDEVLQGNRAKQNHPVSKGVSPWGFEWRSAYP